MLELMVSLNNVNLLANVRKIFNKVSKKPSQTSITFSSIIDRKDKTKIQKTLTDTNARLKIFCMQKGISFTDNSGINEFHLGKRKGTVLLQKIYRITQTGNIYFFLYESY